MKLSQTDFQGITVLRVGATRIDAASAGAFKDSLIALVDRGISRFVIDLSDVDFIDSTGLGMLVGVHRTAHEMKGGLHLMNANREVRRLLQVTGLESLFGSGTQAAA